MTRVDLGGFALNVEVAGQGPPVVLLHGFTGSAAGWAPTVDALSSEFTTIAVDIVGHGKSDAPASLDHYRMEQCVDDLVAVVRKAGYDRACWLGYSMGGRTALQVAVRRPEAVSVLILEGGSPGLATAEERVERVRSDEALAERIEREGVEKFVAYWESIGLFSTQSDDLRAVLRPGRLACSATGLANSLRGMGTGAQPALHERLGEVRVPVLLLAGALDVKFTGIAHEMARAFPDASMEAIEDAGHAAHLEQPDTFHHLALDFLRVHAARAEAGSSTANTSRTTLTTADAESR
jgi:2-succinyl-6-hydroxy-2,4-cyclohexadiene-1-carboxylate synthase